MKLLLALAGPLLLLGCSAVGPGTIPRDRFDYGQAISRSWQEQMLVNLVKLRYADMPTFLEVASVINQYELQGELGAGATFQGSPGIDSQGVSGSARWTDRPTITYTLLTGDKFTRSLLTPVRPESILFLVQAGWPVDFILLASLRAMNGVYGRSRIRLLQRDADPELLQLLAALRRIQGADALGIRTRRETPDAESLFLFFRREGAAPELSEDIQLVQRLLRLDPEAAEYRVVFGAVADGDREIAFLSRSMMEVMMEIAMRVEVPPEHVASGRVGPPPSGEEEAEDATGAFIRIHSGEDRPEESFVAVRYRDHWFWVDDRDFASKRVFSLLLILFTLAESGDVRAAPLVTIGAGG